MIISKVRIENFKSIQDSDQIQVTKLFALIGKNNCGKSTIVDALQAFWRKKGKEIEEQDFHKATNNEIKITVTFSGELDSESAKKYQSANQEIEISFIASKSNLKGEHQINGKKVPPKDLESLFPELLVIPAIRNPKNETTGGANSFLEELAEKLISFDSVSPKSLKELEELKGKDLDVDQLNTLLKSKIHNYVSAVSETLSDHFQSSIDDDSLRLEIDPESDLSKAIKLSTSLHDPHLGPSLRKINVLECGTGLQSMTILALLQTYADQEAPGNFVFLIEEPEVYLHPEFQHKMFATLRKIASKTQVVYTTHSPIMVSDLWADESIKLVKRQKGETIIGPINIHEVISELGVRYDDVLNPKVVVFVEGEDDVEFYEKLTCLLFPAFLSQLNRRVKFVSTDGYRAIHAFALMKILNSDNVTTPFYIIADSDGHVPTNRRDYLYNQIKQKVTIPEAIDLKNKIHIVAAHELEDYLLIPDLLFKLFPKLSIQDLKDFVQKYREYYKAALIPYRQNTNLDLKILQESYKPSILFDSELHPKKLEKIRIAYANNDKFMETRESLSKAWSSLGGTGPSKIRQFFDVTETAERPEWNDPVTFIRKIISEIEPHP